MKIVLISFYIHHDMYILYLWNQILIQCKNCLKLGLIMMNFQNYAAYGSFGWMGFEIWCKRFLGLCCNFFSELHSSLMESSCASVSEWVSQWVSGQECEIFSSAFVVWHGISQSALKHFIEHFPPSRLL